MRPVPVTEPVRKARPGRPEPPATDRARDVVLPPRLYGLRSWQRGVGWVPCLPLGNPGPRGVKGPAPTGRDGARAQLQAFQATAHSTPPLGPQGCWVTEARQSFLLPLAFEETELPALALPRLTARPCHRWSTCWTHVSGAPWEATFRQPAEFIAHLLFAGPLNKPVRGGRKKPQSSPPGPVASSVTRSSLASVFLLSQPFPASGPLPWLRPHPASLLLSVLAWRVPSLRSQLREATPSPLSHCPISSGFFFPRVAGATCSFRWHFSPPRTGSSLLFTTSRHLDAQ